MPRLAARLFSLVEDDGTKLGGDLPLAASLPTNADAAPGVTASPAGSAGVSSILTPSEPTHFVVWSASAQVVREVIACDP